MTIIAGFPQRDEYVLLASDSEQASHDGIGKSHVWKIARLVKHKECHLLIGGAGDGDFVDEAVARVRDRLAPPFSQSSVANLLHAVVLELHEQIDKAYPESERNDHLFHLLSAVWVKDEGVALVKTVRGLSARSYIPVAIGIGSYLADYLIDTLYMPKVGQRTLSSTRRLATSIVDQAKKHCRDCSGEPLIVWMTNDGTVHHSDHATILKDQQHTHIFNHTIFRRMWHAIDDPPMIEATAEMFQLMAKTVRTPKKKARKAKR